MKRTFSALALLVAMGCISVNAPVRFDNADRDVAPLQHIVLFKWKTGTSAATIRTIEQGFSSMRDAVPGIVALEWGVNVPENERNQGFTHALVVSFRDAAALSGYATHPAHVAVRDSALPHVEDMIVVDYWPRH